MNTPLHVPASPAVDTLFLGYPEAARLVARRGVVACLRGMVEAIESAFLRWPEFDKSARTAAHSPDGVIELMPVSDARHYAFKYVNGHPVNTRQGLPTVMAFGALADVRTGAPVFLSELTLTTALRTAATSVLAARRLARPDSRTMALVGNGAQSEFQALAFAALAGIRELRLYDVDAEATRKLVGNLRPWTERLGVVVKACASTRAAVEGADIVTTVTADKAYAKILTAGMVESGMHINAVGGDCPGKTELDAAILSAARVFVEYEPQTRIEGEIQQMPADFPVTELWRVLNGSAPGRQSPREVTVFDSVGFALEDYAALRYMRDLAHEAGMAVALPLVPQLADPKDLYGLLAAAEANERQARPATGPAAVPAERGDATALPAGMAFAAR
ncbi:ornithine cyclodeaminase [Verticiella sediminum]|uniref:Ornithine cyclodeaminase n=1 Tax=Verticiella sediminum TaxID=1247510 RepID=A0A556B193_9BURK|nr:ornithine cyclodeaminase [Verticiella sediminum]TSH98932.1 ornithine cyclodeaminase [Verticiella sediminum]